MGFSGILGHISQFLNSSDSVIRWFESSYPSHFGIIRTSSQFVRRSDYFYYWMNYTKSKIGGARMDSAFWDVQGL